jgi:hypothetical protein
MGKANTFQITNFKHLPLLAVCAFLFSSCTMIGLQDMGAVNKRDFGPEERFCVCMYKDDAVSDRRAAEIVSAIREEFEPFGIHVDVPWIRPWQRPGFTSRDILEDIAYRPLEPPCDRLFVLVGRGFKDFLWGVLLPEMNGGVETLTMTKGFAVAELGSLNQLLTLKSPKGIASHEVYHFLGCGHGCLANTCYDQILRIKVAARQNREAGRDFFPAMNFDGRIFWTRGDVNRKFDRRQARKVSPEVGDRQTYEDSS